ncbi:hypothetical protein B0H19DRAFT_1275051 [Mycena capillaripes]|nr:hypothetical protein B0H19DRAFT_1275051 [Mycena capillaripes]
MAPNDLSAGTALFHYGDALTLDMRDSAMTLYGNNLVNAESNCPSESQLPCAEVSSPPRVDPHLPSFLRPHRASSFHSSMTSQSQHLLLPLLHLPVRPVPRCLELQLATSLPLDPAYPFFIRCLLWSLRPLPPNGPRPHILPISLLLFSFTTLHADFFAETEKCANAHGIFCSKRSFESSLALDEHFLIRYTSRLTSCLHWPFLRSTCTLLTYPLIPNWRYTPSNRRRGSKPSRTKLPACGEAENTTSLCAQFRAAAYL